MKKIKAIIIMTLAALCVFAAAGTVEAAFTDVPEDEWYAADVARAAELGLIAGTSDDTFSPDRDITFAEVVRLASSMRQLKTEGAVTLTMGTPWYRPFVDYALENGVITREYDWEAKVTRADYIDIFARSLPDGDLAPMNSVTDGAVADVPMSHPQAESIYKLYRAGVIAGVSESRLCAPGTGITRAEVAAIVVRMMDPSRRVSFTLRPAATLRDVIGEPISVWIDGGEAEGLYYNDTVYLSAADAKKLWSWFDYSAGHYMWQFTGSVPYALSGEGPGAYCASPFEKSDGSVLYFSGERDEYWLPAEWLAGELGCKYLWDDTERECYVTYIPTVDMAALAGRRIPVLMYHAVSDDLWGIEELFASPAKLREQLQYLVDNGYDPIWFSDLSHIDDYDKPVILTFDDGYEDNYTELFPLLKEFNVKATIFIITDSIGKDYYMSEAQAKELADSGLVDIQSHTVGHKALASLGRTAQEYQIFGSFNDVARITKRVPYVLSYPGGSNNEMTRKLAATCYDFGLCSTGGMWVVGSARYSITRYGIGRSTSLKSFANKLGG